MCTGELINLLFCEPDFEAAARLLYNSRSPEIADLVVAANILGGNNHPAIRDSKWFAKLIAADVGAATKIRGNRLAPKMWEFYSLAVNDYRVTRTKLLTWAIDNLKSRGEVNDLIEVVKFGSFEGQRLAANAISDCASVECVDALLSFLKRRTPGTSNVRHKIIKALGDIKSTRSVTGLLEAIAPWDYSTHKEAIQALGKIGGRDVLRAIEEILTNAPSPHAAEAAAEVLCQTRDVRYLGLLLRNRRWVDPHWLSGWIMDALGENCDSDEILELLSEGYGTVSAAKALITLGDFRGIQPVLEILNRGSFPNADTRVAFQPILETMVRSTLRQIPDKLLMDLVQLEDRVDRTLIGDIVISYATERELARLELDRRQATRQKFCDTPPSVEADPSNLTSDETLSLPATTQIPPDEASDPSGSQVVGRNEKCPCGSGVRFKHCHGRPAVSISQFPHGFRRAEW